MSKKTLIIGASTNPERYSFKAAHALMNHGHEIYLLGLREGEVNGETIQTGRPDFEDVHTVTLYVGPRHQPDYKDYIIGLQPQRVIFNPGTENKELQAQLTAAGIFWEEACTLVLLSINGY